MGFGILMVNFTGWLLTDKSQQAIESIAITNIQTIIKCVKKSNLVIYILSTKQITVVPKYECLTIQCINTKTAWQ